MGKSGLTKEEKQEKKAAKRAKKEQKPQEDQDSAPDSTLSTFLLSKADQKDSDLDDIFANSQGPSLLFQPSAPSEPSSKKLKKDKKKKAKLLVEESEEHKFSEEQEEGEAAVPNDADLSELDSDEYDNFLNGLDSDSDEGDGEDDEEEHDSENDDGLEKAYAAKAAAAKLKALSTGAAAGKKRKAEESDSEESGDEEKEESAGEEESDDEELDLENLVHETLLPKNVYKEVPLTAKEIKKAKADKAKAENESNETPDERDARTIFLGNVPVECSTSRPLKKSLIRHVLQSPALLAALPSTCPPLKADSIRFRSLAFASTVFGRKGDPQGDAKKEDSTPHGQKRARNWRETEGSDERGVKGGYRHKEDFTKKSSNNDARQPLTDGQKRRVAFFRGELNEGKKVCNAYLVLAPLPTTFTEITINQVIQLIIKHTNGSEFESLHLRADAVRPRSAAALQAATQQSSRPNKTEGPTPTPSSTTSAYSVPPQEARRTIFMGGLDFAESEENVRAATELVLVRERGVPAGPDGSTWVENVRLIRDSGTGLGKGFGYVLLKDAECVDELLALPFGRPLKVSKRKPRLERCKTAAAAARAKAASTAREAKASSSASSKARASASSPREPPRLSSSRHSVGRPSTKETEHQAKLAEVLAKLPSEERKKLKAVDPERLARRADKKKNKVLKERFERKNKGRGDKVTDILGRSRGMDRARKEKKRVAAGNKTGKRAKF
ncbi:hypothetical protein T439DRAFT_304769 [Meredithblackwellia eburnea MCA 4105]